MQLQGLHQKVELHGVTQQSSGFSIAMNAKAFRVLSSTIYQNKIGSIVRELSANAIDAHKMAGTPEKEFVIHLPDAFEPYFSVKDYGTGIAPEAIQSVFTVYFNSTKDQSNDAIGAFGLGSKTPFSYTDQFTVTNIFGGQKYVYSAFVAEDGQPSIVLLAQEETQEHNGLEINMSVKREDYKTFAEEAKAQLRFLKVKPVVLNCPNFFINPVYTAEDVLAETDNFVLTKANGLTEAYAIQGQIGYVIDLSQLTVNEETSFLVRLKAQGNIYMEFPIGSIGVTASREAIEYTKETKLAIEQCIKNARFKLQADYKNKLQKANNWEIACAANSADLFSIGAGFSAMFNTVEVQPTKARHAWQFSLANTNVVEKVLTKTFYGKRNEGLQWVDANSTAKFYAAKSDCKYKSRRTSAVFSEQKPSDSYFAVIYLQEGQTIEDASALLGGAKVIDLATVPVTVAPRSKGNYVVSTCWKFNDYNSVKDWRKSTIEINEENFEDAYVIPVELRQSLNDTQQGYLFKFNNLRQALYLENSERNVYAIREKDYQKAINCGAKPFSELVQNLENKLKDKLKRIHEAEAIKVFLYETNSFETFVQLAEITDPPKDIKKILSLRDKLQSNYRLLKVNVRNQYSAMQYFSQNTPEVEKVIAAKENFKAKIKEISKRYMFLRIPVYNLKDYTKDELQKMINFTF